MPKKTGTMKAFILKDSEHMSYMIYVDHIAFEKQFFKLESGSEPVEVEITIKRRGK